MNAPIDITGVTLTTKRLILRPWRLHDLNDFFAYASVDGVGQMAGWLPHENRETTLGILNLFIHEKKTFALEYRSRVIGSLGIETYEEDRYPELDLADKRGREIGYVLAKDCWGQGLMTEAVREVIRWLFEDMGLDFIVVGHYERNVRSRRVIEKCGFEYVKTLPREDAHGRSESSREYILYNPARERS